MPRRELVWSFRVIHLCLRDGSIVSFISSANLATNNADGNAEIFTANFGGGAVEQYSSGHAHAEQR